MYWRQSIPLFGGLKFNRTSTGKDYISYRRNGIYMREPVADIKKDIKNIFRPGPRTLDLNEVQKKIKSSFDSYNDAEIFNQVDLLKHFNVSNNDIADIVGSAIFNGSSYTTEQLNHAKGIFSQINCSKSKKKEINFFIDDELKRISQLLQVSDNPQPQLPNMQKNGGGASKKGVEPSVQQLTQIPNSSVKNEYFTPVEIYREDNGIYIKVSEGNCIVSNEKVIISANVTKSFNISEVVEIYKNSGKLFIFIKSRKHPFIISSNDLDNLLDFIIDQLKNNST